MITQQIGEEELQIRQLARDFAEAELRPHVERWDAERTIDPEVLAAMGELGFFGMLVPEEHGGMGFDTVSWAAVLEELAWGEPAVALALAIHGAFVTELILRHGSDEQRARWLEPLALGDLLGCLALAEDESGGDGIRTRATRDGEGWILDGTKRWVTNARIAGLAVVVARTADAESDGADGVEIDGTGSGANGDDGGGLGIFLVPTDAAGYEVGEPEKTMGMRAVETSAVRLREVRVGSEALLGEPDRGREELTEALTLGRVGVAAQAVGIARAAHEHALRYADEREQFGRKIREFEGIEFKLAEMATRLEAASALTRRAAIEPSPRTAAMAKFFASEAAMWVTTQAVQIFGGYGYMRDYPVEKLMRDAKATEIYGGTNETLRVMIARDLYRD